MTRLLTLLFSIMVAVACQSALADEKRAVLVTGASSGIGLKITEHLVANGYHVYAGARKPKDIDRLNNMDNVSAVKLDVTVQSDIQNAVNWVQSQKRPLVGVINNAGVGVFEPMSKVPETDIAWIHDVNVLGPHRVNQAFLPLLKRDKGRTAIIGSISGFLTGANFGAYSMSKFAVEAYTESLADELKDTGVKVAVIEPGSYRSKIREKVTMFNLTGSYDLNQELTEAQKQTLKLARERNEQLKAPDEVAKAVLQFLKSDKPQLRYMVTPNQEQASATIKAALNRVVQLNANQPYAYSRDELVKLLDELIEKNQ